MIHFDIAKLEQELNELEKKTLESNFWDDTTTANSILDKIKSIKNKCKKYREIEADLAGIKDIIDLLKIEYDENLANEMIKDINKIEKEVEKFEIQTLLSGKYDKNNAILTIHPGAGGTEANKKMKDFLFTVKHWIDVELSVNYLKGEMGVHRLVRISPFDSGGRRHTSFASLEVLPEITDDVDLYINPDDIKMDVFRASGAGGQHINKTSSAVRLTHIPTGIITSCQTQRSQLQNREFAMKMLKSKLLDLKEKEHKETIDELKGIQREIAWGSQIRSYVFCPYTMVKDHRTNFEVGNVQGVMDGDLDGFIQSYLKMSKK